MRNKNIHFDSITLVSRSDLFSAVGGLIVRAIVSLGFDTVEWLAKGSGNDASFGAISFANFRSCDAK